MAIEFMCERCLSSLFEARRAPLLLDMNRVLLSKSSPLSNNENHHIAHKVQSNSLNNL